MMILLKLMTVLTVALGFLVLLKNIESVRRHRPTRHCHSRLAGVVPFISLEQIEQLRQAH